MSFNVRDRVMRDIPILHDHCLTKLSLKSAEARSQYDSGPWGLRYVPPDVADRLC
jgi:hypothetical protein